MDSSQNPSQYDALDPTATAPDDVEAHGLKEVAAGIGAAAVLGGAGAGAALAAAPGPATPHAAGKVVHSVQATQSKLGKVGVGRITTPPPDQSANVVRTPAQQPVPVHQITQRVRDKIGPATDAPSDQGVRSLVNKADDASGNTADTARHIKDSTVHRATHLPPTL